MTIDLQQLVLAKARVVEAFLVIPRIESYVSTRCKLKIKSLFLWCYIPKKMIEAEHGADDGLMACRFDAGDMDEQINCSIGVYVYRIEDLMENQNL